jgi:hypothetical protein
MAFATRGSVYDCHPHRATLPSRAYCHVTQVLQAPDSGLVAAGSLHVLQPSPPLLPYATRPPALTLLWVGLWWEEPLGPSAIFHASLPTLRSASR